MYKLPKLNHIPHRDHPTPYYHKTILCLCGAIGRQRVAKLLRLCSKILPRFFISLTKFDVVLTAIYYFGQRRGCKRRKIDFNLKFQISNQIGFKSIQKLIQKFYEKFIFLTLFRVKTMF